VTVFLSPLLSPSAKCRLAEKIKEDRGGGHGNPIPCVHRDRPISESLVEFDRMKNGEYPERVACLRMKMDLDSGNPYMWDTVAYRVKYAPHHRTGDKWSGSDWCTRLIIADDSKRYIRLTTLHTVSAIPSKTSRKLTPLENNLNRHL